MLLNYFKFLSSRLRLSKPWKYKIPLLLGFTYFFILSGAVESSVTFFSFLAAVCTTIGFAGFGYLTNDLSDKKADKLAGKQNETAKLSNISIVGLFIFFCTLAILPWFYLPFDQVSLLLIGIEFALFILYAFPPFRLKEKGLLGVVTDSLYAHVNPAVLASWTFYQVADRVYESFWLFIILLGIWQFISGVRNILYHQIKDLANDELSGVSTFVTSFGKRLTVTALKFVIIPAEVITFICFSVLIQEQINFFFPVLGLFWIWKMIKFKKTVCSNENPIYQNVTNLFLDEFYVLWVPVLLLVGIITEHLVVSPILIIHLLIFRSFPRTFIVYLINRFTSINLKA